MSEKAQLGRWMLIVLTTFVVLAVSVCSGFGVFLRLGADDLDHLIRLAIFVPLFVVFLWQSKEGVVWAGSVWCLLFAMYEFNAIANLIFEGKPSLPGPANFDIERYNRQFQMHRGLSIMAALGILSCLVLHSPWVRAYRAEQRGEKAN